MAFIVAMMGMTAVTAGGGGGGGARGLDPCYNGCEDRNVRTAFIERGDLRKVRKCFVGFDVVRSR